jgi:hypothetical protein
MQRNSLLRALIGGTLLQLLLPSAVSPAQSRSPLVPPVPPVASSTTPGADMFASPNPSPTDILNTPVGPRPRACVHLIPNGADIRDADGTVMLNGAVVAQYPPCAPNTTDAGYNNVAWVQASVSNATYEYAYLTTPALPASPVSGEQLYLWQGLEFGGGNGDILQPMLTYVTNNYSSACPNGSSCYEVNAFFFGNKSNLIYYTPAYLANPGDQVFVDAYTYSSSEWIMYATNSTTGQSAYAKAYEAVPSGSAIMVANSAELYSFSNCNALPQGNYAYWNVSVFTGSAFGQYNGPVNLTWSNNYGWNSSMGIPSCDYSTDFSANNGNASAYVYWYW